MSGYVCVLNSHLPVGGSVIRAHFVHGLRGTKIILRNYSLHFPWRRIEHNHRGDVYSIVRSAWGYFVIIDYGVC